jgi:hypothetical protein
MPMSRSPGKSDTKPAQPGNPFRRASAEKADDLENHKVHLIRPNVRCDTESRGHPTPSGRSITEIVADASEEFIPVWAKNTTLRWRFRESSFQGLDDPAAAKASVQQLLGECLPAWGNAAPVKFAKRNDSWDFEMRAADDCDASGCVLASAFFPDAGRHKLVLYPRMFEQTRKEQVETLVHEIGHIFGLRHFFALVSETEWPAKVFGKHHKFSIMNNGEVSKLTSYDKSDLKRLYELAWSGQLTKINGTPIRFVKPFHETGAAVEGPVAIAAMRAVVVPRSRGTTLQDARSAKVAHLR